MGGSNRNCPGHGYHVLSSHGNHVTIYSEDWEGYLGNTDCRFSVYAPGAKHIRIRIYEMEVKFWL